MQVGALCTSARVFVCVRVRTRARCVRVCVRACVRACVCARVRAVRVFVMFFFLTLFHVYAGSLWPSLLLPLTLPPMRT